MINRFFIFLLFFVSAMPALAQNCVTNFEQIFDLKTPAMGSLLVWNGTYGSETMQEGFRSGVALTGSGHVVAAGVSERKSDDLFGPFVSQRRLIVAEFDRRGRLVWQKEASLRGLVSLQKILPHQDGYVALAHFEGPKNRSRMALLFLDARGVVVKQNIIQDDKLHLVPRDIERRWGDEGYIVVATGSTGGNSIAHSLFYKLDNAGTIINQKSFRTGLNNIILSIQRSDERFYVVTGQAEDPKYRQNGWIMKLSKDAEIVWQRQYSRGNGARLLNLTDFPGRRMIATGQVLSAADGSSAAWVMMLDRLNGNPLWHRFYRGAAHNSADDVVVGEDEVATVLINSKPRTPTIAPHDHVARVVTLNPRGVLFIADDYFSGEGVHVHHMLNGFKRERVLVGQSRITYDVEREKDENGDPIVVKDRSHQGWVAARPAPEVYIDPCVPFEQRQKPAREQNPVLKDAEAIFP